MSQSAILVVEDDVELRDALCAALASGDYPVLSAGDGVEALALLDSQPVGLVVSDVQMEPMNGHELLGHIRQRHPRLPAVLMTAYGTIENAVDAMQSGASDYLVKPFDARDLIAVVDRHIWDGASPDELVVALGLDRTR